MGGALKTEPQLRADVHVIHGQVIWAEMAKAVDHAYKRCERVIGVFVIARWSSTCELKGTFFRKRWGLLRKKYAE